MNPAPTLSADEIDVLWRLVEGGGGRTLTIRDSVALARLINLGLVDVRKTYAPNERGVEALREMDRG